MAFKKKPRPRGIFPPTQAQHFARDDSRGHNAFAGNDFKAQDQPIPNTRKVL